jgi:hypothetical protein
MTGCSWPQTFLLGYVPASGTRHLAVRFNSKMNGTGTLRQFVSKATRPKLPGGLLLSPVCRPVSSNGGLSARHPKTDGSHPVPQGERDPPYRASRPLNRFPNPKHCKDDYLRLPRRRWTASFECAALAMISPALRAKPLSSTGATSALDFNERFAGPCRSSERRCRFFFSPMDDSATCFIDPNARFGALVPCPLISIHGVDVPIRALLEEHYRSAFGPGDKRKRI